MAEHPPLPWATDGTLVADAENTLVASVDWAHQGTRGDRFTVGDALDEARSVAAQIVQAVNAFPTMLDALEAVMHFWGRDPLAFGDEATLNSLAGRFAEIAEQCRQARNLARGIDS